MNEWQSPHRSADAFALFSDDDLDHAIARTQEARVSIEPYISPIDEYPDLSDWRTCLIGAVCLVGVIGYCVLTTGV